MVDERQAKGILEVIFRLDEQTASRIRHSLLPPGKISNRTKPSLPEWKAGDVFHVRFPVVFEGVRI